MAAPMDSDSDTSSSEDEETKNRLREAVHGFVINTPAIKASAKPEENDQRVAPTLPSLRPDKEVPHDNVQDERNPYHTTPGLKKHIAKMLSQALDSDIDSSASCFMSQTQNTKSENGIKLFASSSSVFSLEDEDKKKISNHKPPQKRQPAPSSSDDSSEDERLAAAAVSHDFVLNESQTTFSSVPKPPDVVIRIEGKPSINSPGLKEREKKKKKKKEKRRSNSDEKDLTVDGKGSSRLIVNRTDNDLDNDDVGRENVSACEGQTVGTLEGGEVEGSVLKKKKKKKKRKVDIE